MTYTDDGLYGKARPSPSSPTSGNTQYHVTETRTRTLSPTPTANVIETRTISNNDLSPIPKSPGNNNYSEIVRVENADVLNDIHLAENFGVKPPPKTKVTTTVRTYTYEIPDDGLTRADRDPPKIMQCSIKQNEMSEVLITILRHRVH